MRAEELPADLPRPNVVTFAQSLHWMDRRRVTAAVRELLLPGGAVVHVHATTHEGVDTDERLPHPQPPRAAIWQLIVVYLGPHRRAGSGALTAGTPDPEDVVYQAAGFTGPERFEVPARVVHRTAEEIRASIYSLSGSTPHLLGDQLEAFDAELRQLLAPATADGLFSERMPPILVDIWR
jgi:hypothetical protein